jgi:glutaredoxin
MKEIRHMPSTATAAPYAVDAKNLLDDVRYEAGGHYHPLSPADTFGKNGVETSPLIFIDEEPIGGYDDLRRWLARNAH